MNDGTDIKQSIQTGKDLYVLDGKVDNAINDISDVDDIVKIIQQNVLSDMAWRYNENPKFYPTDADDLFINITGHETAGEWAEYQTLIPSAIIDAESGTCVSVLGIAFDSAEAGEVLHYRLRYNGNIVGQGYIYTIGGGINARRGATFFPELFNHVANEDLEISIQSSLGATDIDVVKVVWCRATPGGE